MGTIVSVARLLRRWSSDPHACAYLPEQQASLEYRLMVDVSELELEHLLARGWRRFGPAYFRPACASCRECVPLRIPVASFRPSKQQRRVWRRASRLRLEIGRPAVDEARLALYHRWHDAQGSVRGWASDRLDANEYYHQFAFPHPSVREFAYYDVEGSGGERLVAVSIVDETPRALSAVYTFHDPSHRRFSLGTASILRQVEVARAARKEWLYLGYRVMGCRSSEYKARFQPHEILTSWPGHEEEPAWVTFEGRWAPAPEQAA